MNRVFSFLSVTLVSILIFSPSLHAQLSFLSKYNQTLAMMAAGVGVAIARRAFNHPAQNLEEEQDEPVHDDPSEEETEPDHSDPQTPVAGSIGSDKGPLLRGTPSEADLTAVYDSDEETPIPRSPAQDDLTAIENDSDEDTAETTQPPQNKRAKHRRHPRKKRSSMGRSNAHKPYGPQS